MRWLQRFGVSFRPIGIVVAQVCSRDTEELRVSVLAEYSFFWMEGFEKG